MEGGENKGLVFTQ